jgi:hypothetical protein
LRELEEKLAKMLQTIRKLPHGPERDELLKEIGRFRIMIDAIKAKQEDTQSGK